MIGHFTDDDRVLEFINSHDLARLAPMGTSVAPTTSCVPRSAPWCWIPRPTQGYLTDVPQLKRKAHAASSNSTGQMYAHYL